MRGIGYLHRAACALGIGIGSIAAQDTPEPQAIVYTGRVVDTEGEPIAGAAVAARAWLPFDTAELLENPDARTGRLGRFRLEGASSEAGEVGRALVLAAPGRMTTVIQHWRLAETDSRRIDVGTVTLPPGRQLAGRVVDADGHPLAGVLVTAAQIAVRGLHQRLTIRRETGAVTGDDGLFALQGAARSGLTVEVFKPGYYFQRVHPVTEFTPLQTELQPSGFVEGRVVDERGRAIEGASIHVSYVFESGPRIRWMSGPDGAFRVPLVHPSRYLLSASWNGRVARRKMDGLEGPQKDIVLRFRGSEPVEPVDLRTLEVRAIDAESRQPILDFGAVLVSEPNAKRVPATRHLFLHGPPGHRSHNGTLALSLPPTRQPHRWILVEAEGYAPGAIELAASEDSAPSKSIAVALERAHRVTGVVVDDSTGKPLPGAQAWALPSGEDGIAYSRVPNRAVATDERGRFHLDGLGRGPHAIQVYHPARPIPRGLDIDVGTDDAEIVVRLEATPRLTARLHGAPAGRGWQLEVNPDRALPWNNRRAAVFRRPSGPEPIGLPAGEQLELELMPGHYTVYATRWSGTQLPYRLWCDVADFDVSGSDGKLAFDLDLARTGQIEGVLATARPVPRERLVVYALNEGDQRDPLLSQPGRSVFPGLVEPDGRFLLELTPGRYTLQVADLATGLVVYVDRTVRGIRANETLEARLLVPLAHAVLELPPPRGADHRIAHRLTIGPTEEPMDVVYATNGSKHNRGELALEFGQRQADVLLPAAPVHIALFGRRLATTEPVGWSTDAIAETTITPRTGQELRVRLEAPR